MSDRSEQWLLEGNCDICRRKNYCKKACTKRKILLQYKMSKAVTEVLDRNTGGLYSKMMEGRVYGKY